MINQERKLKDFESDFKAQISKLLIAAQKYDSEGNNEAYRASIDLAQKLMHSVIEIEKLERGLPAEDSEQGEDITSIIENWKARHKDDKLALQTLKSWLSEDKPVQRGARQK